MQEVRARASSALLFKLANSLLTPADFQVSCFLTNTNEP